MLQHSERRHEEFGPCNEDLRRENSSAPRLVEIWCGRQNRYFNSALSTSMKGIREQQNSLLQRIAHLEDGVPRLRRSDQIIRLQLLSTRFEYASFTEAHQRKRIENLTERLDEVKKRSKTMGISTKETKGENAGDKDKTEYTLALSVRQCEYNLEVNE